jgi:dipeptide/tripeptide permease
MQSNKNYHAQIIPEVKGGYNSYEVKMPEGMPYIVSNELAETASTYGMQAILVIFMTQYLFIYWSKSNGLVP